MSIFSRAPPDEPSTEDVRERATQKKEVQRKIKSGIESLALGPFSFEAKSKDRRNGRKQKAYERIEVRDDIEGVRFNPEGACFESEIDPRWYQVGRAAAHWHHYIANQSLYDMQEQLLQQKVGEHDLETEQKLDAHAQLHELFQHYGGLHQGASELFLNDASFRAKYMAFDRGELPPLSENIVRGQQIAERLYFLRVEGMAQLLQADLLSAHKFLREAVGADLILSSSEYHKG